MWNRCRKYKIFLLVLFIVTNCRFSFAQINVFPAQTANNLAQKLAGQGVTIINPVLNCASVANGIFTVSLSNLGIDSGIVLTTGRSATEGINYGVNGPSSLLASNDDLYPGDNQLDSLARMTTFDACALEFDIIPYGDTIKFDYVFSSEEYINAVCGPYNDAFAFFISGPGIIYHENMALVPGTNIPVTINSINNGIPGSSGNITNCTAMGPGSPFTTYYINNSTGTTLTHNGLTKVLQAIHSVTPCITYHLKLVIADAGDPLYDSGVFLKAGSLQTSSFSIAAVATLPVASPNAFCVKGCLNGKFIVKRNQETPQAQLLRYTTGGTAISGIDYYPLADSIIIPADSTSSSITVNAIPTPLNGDKTLVIYILAPYSCTGVYDIIDSAVMTIYDSLHVTIINNDTSVCVGDSVQLWATGSTLAQYFWLPDTAISNAGILNPVVFPTVNTVYSVTAAIPGTTCSSGTTQIRIGMKLTPVISAGRDTAVCYQKSLALQANTTVDNSYYSYLWSGPNNYTSTLKNPVFTNLSDGITGPYSVTITIDTNGCKSTSQINVSIFTPSLPTIITPPLICQGDDTTNTTGIRGSDILWYQNQTDTTPISKPIITTDLLGNYSYFITQTIDDCESPKEEFDVSIKKCCDGIIFIPTAFSPNGDGRNDKFVIHDDFGYFIKSLSIFNRWGEVVYAGKEGIWDGNYKGMPAEVGTYFYEIVLGCVKGGIVAKKGDITLVR